MGKKIIVRKAQGTMGMGTGTDTRMYAPRSESSYLFRNNHEDEASVYSPESGNFKDERMERKKRKREERERELKRLKHIRIKPSDLPPSEDDEEEEDEDLAPTKFDNELEPSLMTGTRGNYGALTSLATQARGPGFAGGHAFAMGEPMDIAFQLLKREGRQGFVGGGKRSRKKRSSRERREHKERSKKWRPSTGQFKRPPGGMTPRGATTRRAKARMRGIKSGKKTGLSRAHLAVEMSHRGVKTKQPMSKDPRRYRQYMGQQEARKRLGNIRTVAATPPRFGARSYHAGLTGGGTLQSLLSGQAQQMRRPTLRAHRAPPLIPPRLPGIPRLPQPGIPSPPPIPQASRGVGVQNMAEQSAMYTPSKVPTASVQGGYPSPSPPASIMMGKVGVGSDLQKRGLSYYDIAELRQLINDARKAMKRKESKKKGKGEKSIDAASHLPAHTEAGPLRTSKNEGATQDETDARRFGINPLDHLTSRGGRTP